MPEESDGYFDAESCEFNQWFMELDGESLPPNRVEMEMGEDKAGRPNMRLFIYMEDLVNLIGFKKAIERQERCKKSGGENPNDGKIWVDVSPSLHDTDLGPVILTFWDFRGASVRAPGRPGDADLPSYGIASALTPMSPFNENGLRHLAWLAKFEALPASVVYNRDQTDMGWDSVKRITEHETLSAYELGSEFLDEIDGCELEFEASIRNGAAALQFARKVKDIAQVIPKPDNWHGSGWNPVTEERTEHARFWEAAVRAYIEPNENVL